MVLDYSSDEIAVVRRAIAPPPLEPPEEVIEAMRAAAGMPVPDHMLPFWKLSELEMPLFMRLTGDPVVKELSEQKSYDTTAHDVPTTRTAGASTAEKAGGIGCGGSRGDRFLRPLSRVADNIWLDVRQQPASVVMEQTACRP
jgi:hypothetical protein